MHDVVLIELLERLEQLPKDHQRLLLLQHLLLLKQRFQCPAIAVLIHEVKVIGSLEGLDEPDDVVVLQRRQDVDFVYGELLQFRVGLERRFGDDLDSVL